MNHTRNRTRRTSNTRRKRQPRARPPRYFAMDLSDGYLAQAHSGADDEQRENIQCVILCAGQHLADCGVPGEWDRFDPQSFLEKMPGSRAEICGFLTGVFEWLEENQLLPRVTARDILHRIAASSPRPGNVGQQVGNS